MKKSLISLLVYLISCGISLSISAAPNAEHMKTILPRLERFIKQTMKTKHYPGLAIAIVSKDHIHYLKTFGVKRLGNPDPVTADTLFQIGSISKAITSTLLARLQKQKLLKTDDIVSSYLPEFRLKGASTPLQIWHIMSHSSGVSGKGFNQMIEAHLPRNDIQKNLQETPVTAEPGLDFSYNNAMFSVIEDIMENATGSSYQDLLKKYLLTPLAMDNVSTSLEALKNSSDRAYPHVKNKQARYVPAKRYSSGYYAVVSAGGINASLNDLIPFLQLHLGKYPELLNENDLKPFYQALLTDLEAAEWLHDGQNKITDVQYGLGWRLTTFEGEKIIFHGGWLDGFINFLAFLPEHNVGIIVLQNTESSFAKNVALKFFALYTRALAEQ